MGQLNQAWQKQQEKAKMVEEKQDKKMVEEKQKETKEVKKEEKKIEKNPKTEAIVNGSDLRISTKYSAAICKMIRGKRIEEAIKLLEEVLAFKRPVKMNKLEVPHKKGKGVMAGRYPINASKEFLRLLKQLQANAIVNELELEKGVLFCKANKASRPYRSGGRQFKRTHLTLKLEIKNNKEGKK